MATRALSRRRSAAAAVCKLENLEARRLLASAVEGFVFYDANQNGTQDAGEPRQNNFTIFIDTNGDGHPDAGERQVISGVGTQADGVTPLLEGQWRMDNLPDSSPVTVSFYSGTARGVNSAGATRTVTTGADGSTVQTTPFGYTEGSISGFVFFDDNANGIREAGEAIAPFVRVYLDNNGNGFFDAGDNGTFVESNDPASPTYGRYVFPNLTSGNYNVRVAPGHAQRQVSPTGNGGTRAVALTPGQNAPNLNFGVQTAAAIGGQVFNDTNGNGTRDAGETLAAGIRVFADINGNGTFDAGEPSANSQAAANDIGQNYVIQGMNPGTYTIRATNLPTGATGTNPASQSVTVALGQETGFGSIPPVNIGVLGEGVTPPPPPPPGGLNDFNGDGNVDTIVQSGDTVQVWYLGAPTASGNLKNINRIGVANLDSPGAGWTVGGYGDFDGDDRADVLYHNDASGANVIYTFNGVTKTGEINLPTLANTAWRTVTAGDFDGDGDLDIMWRNSATGQNTLWLLDNLVPTFKALPTAASQNWIVAGTGDYDGDGDRDILWYNHSTNRSSTWLIDVTQSPIRPTFRGGPTLGAAVTGYRRFGVDDFDKDGLADILWADPSNPAQNSIWYMNTQTGAEKLKGFGRVTGI